MSFLLSVALIILCYRRVRDLAAEVKARHAAEQEAQGLARRDLLTALPNRRFFTEKLSEVLGLASSHARRTAVFMLDFDGFKAINGAHGRAAGDRGLIEFAERVSGVIRRDTVLARVGGDEFGPDARPRI